MTIITIVRDWIGWQSIFGWHSILVRILYQLAFYIGWHSILVGTLYWLAFSIGWHSILVGIWGLRVFESERYGWSDHFGGFSSSIFWFSRENGRSLLSEPKKWRTSDCERSLGVCVPLRLPQQLSRCRRDRRREARHCEEIGILRRTGVKDRKIQYSFWAANPSFDPSHEPRKVAISFFFAKRTLMSWSISFKNAAFRPMRPKGSKVRPRPAIVWEGCIAVKIPP